MEDHYDGLDSLQRFEPYFSVDKILEPSMKIALAWEEYGPIRQHEVVKIPLWVGLRLEKSKQGHLLPPVWLDEQMLKRTADLERQNPYSFQRVDPNYIHVGQTFLQQAHWFERNQKRAIEMALRTLIKTRRMKCNEGMQSLDSELKMLDCTNLTNSEVTWYRERATSMLHRMHKLRKKTFWVLI